MPKALAIAGFAALALLLAAILAPGLLHIGSRTDVPLYSGAPLRVPVGTTFVTLSASGLAWALLVYASACSSRVVRLTGAALFLLSNSLLVASLPSGPGTGMAAAAISDTARAAYIACPVALALAALMPSPAMAGPGWRAWLARLALALPVLMFACLLALVAFSPSGPATEVALATGTAQSLATLVLLLAPLFYLSGMAVLSLTYAVGTVAGEVVGRVRAGGRSRDTMAWGLVAVLVGAEAWFYGWRDRSQLWPGTHGWVVCLHVAPIVAGFAAIAYTGRRALSSGAEPVRDNASAASALLVAVPNMVAGLYICLYTVSSLGFLHVPGGLSAGLDRSVAQFVQLTLRTGPRCALFGLAAVGAIAALQLPSLGARRRQFAFGFALISTWVFWLLFIDWLPATDTEDSAFICLVALGLVTAYLALRLYQHRAVDLDRAIGLLVVLWLFDADAGPLRSLGHLVPAEGAIALVVGTLLVLVGKSQFANRDGFGLPRPGRVLAWTAYLVLALCVGYWEHGVSGFAALTKSNADFSVLTYIAVPYMAWLVLVGRLKAGALRSGPAAELTDDEVETPTPTPTTEPTTEPPAPGRARPPWAPAGAALISAGVLAGVAWGAFALINAAVPQPRALRGPVGILVPPSWHLSRLGQLAIVASDRPPADLMVAVAAKPPAVASLLALFHRAGVGDLRLGTAHSLALSGGGNFTNLVLVDLNASFRGTAVHGLAFFLLNVHKGTAADGIAFAPRQSPWRKTIAPEVINMAQSLNNPSAPPLW